MFTISFLSDLSETFTAYYDEFIQLLPKLLIAVILYILLHILALISEKISTRWLKRSMDDLLLARFISKLIKFSIIIAAILMCMKLVGLGSLVTGILGTAGVGAFILGFAFKDIGEHFLAGILLAFNRPFRVGDTVELNSVQGVVQSLSLRNTRIKSFDGQDIFIPNGNIIKNPLVNYTLDGFYRYDFNIVLDSHIDIIETINLIEKEIRKVPGVLTEEKTPSIAVTVNETNNLVFKVLYWLNTDDKSVSPLIVKNTTIRQITSALLKEGYKLPGNTVELYKLN